ncbi:succinate-semialdehyde dehydrogenase / glutarate-semialdehyde dehydrogenase [Flavobacteriaceae bacterium MAR_2010_188]|nr:succinate-semialdehyde dehydrogenase / glutarate-semialdehyde dehydrogenase [Flavobacteriaceae bacterium MAR_2010_188]
MQTYKTINPFNGEELESYKLHSSEEIEEKIATANATFRSWRKLEVKDRVKCLKTFSKNMESQKNKLAELITNEMGKPISESIAEIEKCVFLCDFYAKNADLLLSDEIIETEAEESFISYDPLGIILAVMPWNYPFWQVMRFAIPTLTAGNVGILKHATNVSGCAMKIQELFEQSGYPTGCFTTILSDHENLENLIADDRIKAVTLTGSEKAGRSIAEISGKHLKKNVLELGGNNACIVFKDANLKKYLKTMVKARMQNTGQSCIAAKRFIVVEDIYEEFLKKFKKEVESIKIGNPQSKDTELTVLARKDLAETLKKQVEDSVKKGAKVLLGNSSKDSYFAPTILTDVTAGMPVFDEETFGPVAAIIKVKNEKEALETASNSKFGLGTMLFTEDTEAAIDLISEIEDGAFFINEMVKSDPRLPFGGTKASGYGRELSKEGILEFVNKKTVYINK